MKPTTIHAMLTVEDRDELDRLRSRIRRHGVLIEYVLAHHGGDDDFVVDEDLQDDAVESLVDLASQLVEDADAIDKLLSAAHARETTQAPRRSLR